MRLRTVPLVMVISIAGLGLIGVGAHATFTTSTSSGQTITEGTSGVSLAGLCVDGTTCPLDANSNLFSLSSNGSTLTFTSDTPTDTSFTTGDEQATATNTGNLVLNDPTWVLNATGGTELENEAYVCATSMGIGSGGTNSVLYNGPLSTFLGTSYSLTGDVLSAPGTPATSTSGPTDNFVVDIYAGSEPTSCGTSFTNGTGLVGGNGVSASVGSAATSGISEAPTLNSDSAGESIAIIALLTYQD